MLAADDNDYFPNENLGVIRPSKSFAGDSFAPICLRGKLSGFECEYFIDCGASDMFISTEFIRKRNLSGRCSPLSSPRVVALADGRKCEASLIFHAAEFSGENPVLQGKHDLLVLPLPGYEVILGMRWLKTLNPEIDWKQGLVTARSSICTIQKDTKEEESISSEDSSVFQETVAKLSNKVALLLKEYRDVFRETLPAGLPMERPIEHQIKLKPESLPAAMKQWRLSPKNIEEQDKQCAKALAAGQIRLSTSPYNAPSVFISKPDGSCRWCQDYRMLNTRTAKNKLVMPRIDDLFDRVRAKFYTKLDLKQGFNQIRIAKEDVEKTAFSTSTGHYEWMVMPFGLCNAPATFQSLMQFILKDRLHKSVVVFIDDILIYSNSEEEHMEQVEWVLKQLKKWRLYAAIKKCEFFKSEIVYLGYLISENGISVLTQRVKAILEWPDPRNIKEVRSFLGLAGYDRKFVKDFSKMAAPLTELTKDKQPWTWGPEQITAFNAIKTAMTSTPTLLIPKMDLPFTITTDASGYAVGAVLSQDQGNGLQPVAYMSHKMSGAERKYPVHEQELLAIISALKDWRCYLHSSDQPVHIITDHRSLTFINTQPHLSARQTRWVEFLQDFNFIVSYQKGTENEVADALSRRGDFEREAAEEDELTKSSSSPEMPRIKFRLAPISVLEQSPLLEEIRVATTQDLLLQQVLADPGKSGFSLENGLLKNQQGCVVVPNDRSLRAKLLREVHDAPTGGHLGIEKTLTRLGRYFWWQGIRSEVQQYVKSCHACQSNKSSNQAPAGLLHPLPIPTQGWDQVSMDFVGPLPITVHGNDFILVVVDRLTKMAHFLPCKQTITAPQVARLFWRDIVRLHGIPSAILSDRDPRFTSKFWQELWRLMGTQLPMSTAYHPQTDGQTERMNRLMEEILRSYVRDKGDDWDEHLTAAEIAVNTSKHTSTEFTPFRLNYGREMRLPLDVAMTTVSESRNPAAAVSLQDMYSDVQLAQQNIAKAQQRQAFYADQRRREADDFKVGDRVMLNTADFKGRGKLMSKYVGPFRITSVLPDKMVELEMPAHMQLKHPRFNVSKVKMFESTSLEFPERKQLDRPPPVMVDGGDQYFEVEAILGKRRNKIGRTRRFSTQYLVKWFGYDVTEATWQDESELDAAEVRAEIEKFEALQV